MAVSFPHRLSCGFCVVVTHAASWEPFSHCHPRFSCGETFTLRDCVAVFVILFCLLSCRGRTAVFRHVVIAFAIAFGTVASPCHELCLLLHFGAAVDCLESFWP